MTTVRVTPLAVKNLVENGVKLVEKFDATSLRKLPWPAAAGRRAPDGGDGGVYRPEPVKIEWKQNKLVFPFSDGLEIEVAHREGTKVTYDGVLLTQLDGDVAYFAERHIINVHQKDFLVFVAANAENSENPQIFRALLVPHGFGIVVEANVPHSVPIPLHDNSVTFNVYHRGVNSVAQFKLPAPLSADSTDIDDQTVVSLVKQTPVYPTPSDAKVGSDIIDGVIKVVPATKDVFEPYGVLTDVENHKEKVTSLNWTTPESIEATHGLTAQLPADDLSACRTEPLEQEFKMTWTPHATEKDLRVITFTGKSGTLGGQEGKPGVEYDRSSKVFSVETLLTRPDGSFYLRPITKSRFLLVVAAPDPATGEPIKDTLKAFDFPLGSAPRLNPGVWHSVPIPHSFTESLEFREVIAETNANTVINVNYEAGGPIKFSTV